MGGRCGRTHVDSTTTRSSFLQRVVKQAVRVATQYAPLCANLYFSLPRPLCSRAIPDVRDRQTDRCQTSDKSIA